MEQLKKIGKIIPKKSSEIKHSKISLGDIRGRFSCNDIRGYIKIL